ncbi:SUKH-4 family immunity protein [Streptomyces griseorubiginosus]|uniref:SUKH-4 family immunity protein n=1 Tax=Streptomyces griseorubiginosus TaxID=67304 RepID=UPI003691CAFB
MSTTDAAVAAIRLTEDELRPYITHASTRSWLSGPGLPGNSDLFSFEELRRQGLRTVADSTSDPGGRLSEELRDQLVIGGLTDLYGRERESVLLDGATGEVSTTAFFHARPDLMGRTPLAPSLPTLVRFATATDELTEVRGQFASYAGRFGPTAVEEATRQLLTVFEEGTGGDVPTFWKIAALIRPLALVAGPGTDSGLALDLPPRLLDHEFGRNMVARFEDIDFPSTLTHAPTRRFLAETGLPEDGVLFHTDPDAPLPTLAEHQADRLVALPPRADHLIVLGHLIEDNTLVVDGETGAVLNWSEREATLHPLNTDISTLAFTLWLLHRERRIDESLAHELTNTLYAQVAKTMIRALSTIDPTGTTTDEDWHYWTELFQDEAGGVL